MEVDFGGAFLAVGVLLMFVIVGVPLLIHYSSRKTTQHAPLPPPLPTTRLGWLSLVLAAVSVVLFTFAVAAVISPFTFKTLGIELEWILWRL